MILKRLYELAERTGLLASPAFDSAPVACLISIDDDGRYLGLKPLRRSHSIPSKRKGGKPKVVTDRGRPIPLPVRPVVATSSESAPGWKVTDPAVNGAEKPAVFLADTLGRVLPLNDLIPTDQRRKFDAQRSTFWRFLGYAADQTADPALKAVRKFGESISTDPTLGPRITAEVQELGLTLSHLCTFAWLPDENAAVIERAAVRDWWQQFYGSDVQGQQDGASRALCQVTEVISPLPSSVKLRISGLISIGCRAEAYLLAPLPSAESYNFDGAATAMVSDQAIDGFTRALNALIGNALPGSRKTAVRLGNVMFLFWARQQSGADDIVSMLEEANEDDVARFLESMHRGSASLIPENDFYCLTLSGNSARVVVRDYLEQPLPKARERLAAWFHDLRIIDLYRNELTSAFPLWLLAAATVRDIGDVSPSVPTHLLGAALKGDPIPDHLLAACLRRLHAEGGDGFRPARMALIKLALKRSHPEGPVMTETLDPALATPSYLCGRLLAVFERVQYFALGEVNATVVDRYYGTASTAPALVFPRLFKSAEQHLSKMHGESPGLATNLQKDVERIAAGLKTFPSLLSLAEQGQFALGFYHQRAAYRTATAERKRRAGADAEAKAAALP